jgi:ABC-2 type transport system ATP-binding protein/manganese/iron transport system ATP-binding protein
VTTTDRISVGPGLHLLVAPNGSGKTTLLRTLAGLHPAIHGSPSIKGRVHYVSDELRMDPELAPRTLFQAWFTSGALSQACELADKFKLDLKCAIGKHSRGNRQKVLLVVAETLAARAGSTVLLMDEPFTGLDAGTRDIVAAHWASTPSILRLVVLHELESVAQADSLFTIAGGTLHHTRERKGRTWAETAFTLC